MNRPSKGERVDEHRYSSSDLLYHTSGGRDCEVCQGFGQSRCHEGDLCGLRRSVVAVVGNMCMCKWTGVEVDMRVHMLRAVVAVTIDGASAVDIRGGR
jgi:hypothetical protein